jgi:hypothetical protein
MTPDLPLVYCGSAYTNDIVFSRRGQNEKFMGTANFAIANSIITDLSYRAVVGATVVLFLLLLLTVLIRHNERLKQVLFLLVVATILFASTVLFTTAIVHLQDTATSATGVTSS